MFHIKYCWKLNDKVNSLLFKIRIIRKSESFFEKCLNSYKDKSSTNYKS